MKHRLAIFVSGNGTNAEAIMNYFRDHALIEVDLLLTNNPNAYAIERAKKSGVPSKVFSREEFRGEDVVRLLASRGVTHVVLAGFLWLIPENLIKAYPDHIINIHPALLPKYGGKGMYGLKVHEAVRASGDTRTGITIHLVNTQYDEGEILAQESVEVESTDTPEEIASKVHELEYKYYPVVIEKWVNAEVAPRIR
ncbi:MAG: phosphoribosylglycinamide formyltransferase [Bacteroidota bacterium]